MFILMQAYKMFVILGMITVSFVVVMIVPIYAAEDSSNLLDRIVQLETLIKQKNDIIMEQLKVISYLAKKPYEPFSLEAFPATDGFNPEWLTDNAEKIRQTCNDAESDGYYGLKYCNHIP